VVPNDDRDAAARVAPPDVSLDVDAAVVELYEREYTGIARLAFLLVGDRHRAEDLAHDAFVRLYENWDDVEPAKALAWLRATTSNLAMSSHRRARTARKHQQALGRSGDDASARSAEVIALSRSARPDVVKALQTLSPRQRTAVVLKHWLRMTESEIADALGCSLGTTRTHLSRGHDALSRKLGGHR
jgi:RNA polymerase sigma factor (sigma-70 family)